MSTVRGVAQRLGFTIHSVLISSSGSTNTCRVGWGRGKNMESFSSPTFTERRGEGGSVASLPPRTPLPPGSATVIAQRTHLPHCTTQHSSLYLHGCLPPRYTHFFFVPFRLECWVVQTAKCACGRVHHLHGYSSQQLSPWLQYKLILITLLDRRTCFQGYIKNIDSLTSGFLGNRFCV